MSHGFCFKLECNKCFNRSFASHSKSKYWSDKNDESPRSLFKNSNKKYYFDCYGCGHELYIKLSGITQHDSWCKYCNMNVLCDDENCDTCFQKSMASHPMGKCWSSKNDLGAGYVGKGSEKKYWFNCPDCKHEFQTTPASIKKDKHCPYCSNQTLCSSEDCQYCFKKSCASTNIAKKWHSSNEKTPRQVAIKSNKKVTLYCDKCNHTMSMPPNKYNTRSDPCTYCTGHALCDSADCTFCFHASFASHPHAAQWSPKNKTDPRTIRKGAEKRFIFNCETCDGEFESLLYNVLTGYWCPHCKNKSEAILHKFLLENYSDTKRQPRFDWCVNPESKQKLPFDFLLPSKNVIIELDGIQHFQQVSNWGTPEKIQARDKFKQDLALANSYRVIRIYQEDFWKDASFDWRKQLLDAICCEEKNVIYLDAGGGIKYNSNII